MIALRIKVGDRVRSRNCKQGHGVVGIVVVVENGLARVKFPRWRCVTHLLDELELVP